jgi:predicted metal-dependent HD superfamily phosphohydrolase
MDYQELLKKISEHVVQFYLQHPDERLFYHNLAHTDQILESISKINSYYKLDERNSFIISAAAWFHDAGIVDSGLQSHEEKSVELAENYLKEIGVNEEEIAEIKKCILATQMPQKPNSLNEKIICDADLFNLGTDTFLENNVLVRKEIEALTNTKISVDEWRTKSITLLENHSYHTEYCQSLLNKTKDINLKNLKEKDEEKK